MPIHDAYLRRTPIERLRPDSEYPGRHLAAIDAELETRGVRSDDPGAFAMLDAVGAATDELRRPEDGMAQSHQHAILLFHAIQLLRSDGSHELIRTGVARWAVEVATMAWAPGFRQGARYVQLPQHLFWVREEGTETPASLDGYFLTSSSETLHVLGVMGVSGPDAGFRVLALPPLPIADAPIWASEPMREGGEDFRSEIPGADIEGLYEIRTSGELLKLIARLDAWARLNPDSGVEVAGGAGAAGDASLATPSDLNYTRWELD